MSTRSTSEGRPDITVRRPQFDFSSLPHRWVADSALATHFGNAGHVFIPLGEEFFIDTVREVRDVVEDPELQHAVKAFVGQEAVHKRAHEQLWQVLRERGVPVDVYARLIASVRSLERVMPVRFRLSVTAALEHYTAAFGHSFLTEDLAGQVPEEMARLLAWHGLEELEHRAVAFDVLQVVDDRYALRLAGFAFATGLIVVVPTAGAALFALADPGRLRRRGRESGLGGMAGRLLGKMAHHLADYLKPGFHPSDLEMPPEAQRWATELDGVPAA